MIRSAFRWALAGALACALALTAATAAPVTVTDIAGRTVTLPAPAKRVVLGQGRQLNAFGLLHPDPVSLLAGWGADHRRQNPDAYRLYRERFPAIEAVPTVGDGASPNGFSFEQTVALMPDLAVLSRSLAGTRRGPGDLVERFEAAGIPVAVIDFYLDPLKETVPSLRALGKLIGREEQAERVVGFYERHMGRISERLAGAPRPDVFMHTHAGGFDCCTSPGKGTLDAFITAAGGRNIAAALLPGASGQISLEQLISADPRVYIATGGTHLEKNGGLVLGLGVPDEKAQKSFAKLLTNPGLATLTAVREGRAFGLWQLFNDTPLHVVAIEAMATWIHPERFAEVDPAVTLKEAQTFSPIRLDGPLWITSKARSGEATRQ